MGFYIMGAHTSASWHATHAEAADELARRLMLGAWQGTRPTILADRDECSERVVYTATNAKIRGCLAWRTGRVKQSPWDCPRVEVQITEGPEEGAFYWIQPSALIPRIH